MKIKVRNQPVVLKTAEYSFEELADILLHERNRSSQQSEEYRKLAALLAGEDKAKWEGYLQSHPREFERLFRLFGNLKLENPLREIADQFLDSLLFGFRSIKEFPLPQYTAAKNMSDSPYLPLLEEAARERLRNESRRSSRIYISAALIIS